MEFLQDTNIWVTFSFIIFLFVLFKFGAKGFLGMLDSRIENIRSEIETAENLRVEAQELLAQYQRKQKEAEKEAQDIVQNAKEHAKEIQKQATKQLKEDMARKEQQLKERMKRMEDDAVREMQAYAAKLAVKATTEIINDNMDEKARKELANQSIENIATKTG